MNFYVITPIFYVITYKKSAGYQITCTFQIGKSLLKLR